METQPQFNYCVSLRRLLAKSLEDHTLTCLSIGGGTHTLPTRELASTLPLRFPYNRWGVRRSEEWLSDSLALALVCCQLGPPSAEHRMKLQPLAPSSPGADKASVPSPVSLVATAAVLRSSSSDTKGFVLSCWAMWWGCGHWLPVMVPMVVLIQGWVDLHCCVCIWNVSIHEYILHS